MGDRDGFINQVGYILILIGNQIILHDLSADICLEEALDGAVW